MNRKIKKLGLAFVAIAAMSMVVAAGAQATQLHATHNNHVSIFGQQDPAPGQHVFQIDSGQVKCNQALFEGTVNWVSGQQVTTDEWTLTPTFTGCQAFGLAAIRDTNGCKYTITGTDRTTAGNPTFQGTTAQLDITGCTTGKQIEITAGGSCVVTIPEQHHLNHIVFQNNPQAVPHDVTAHFTLSGITYESHGACPNLPTPTIRTHNGTYHGTATFQAREHVAAVHASHNGHTYFKLPQTGALKGLEVT